MSLAAASATEITASCIEPADGRTLLSAFLGSKLGLQHSFFASDRGSAAGGFTSSPSSSTIFLGVGVLLDQCWNTWYKAQPKTPTNIAVKSMYSVIMLHCDELG